GKAPVMNVACTVHVTAGVTVVSGRMTPPRASAAICGVCGPKCRGVKPTTRITIVVRMISHRVLAVVILKHLSEHWQDRGGIDMIGDGHQQSKSSEPDL